MLAICMSAVRIPLGTVPVLGTCTRVTGTCIQTYCTGQRNLTSIFFNRLRAPPRRLDLSQDVLRTTECASDRSGDAWCILRRVVKSAAARARRTLFSTKIVRACTSLVRASTILVRASTILVWACTSLLRACTSFITCTSLDGAKY